MQNLIYIENKEVSVRGRLFQMARLRHEWCDFLDDPVKAISGLRSRVSGIGLFTFVHDICDHRSDYPFHRETEAESVLRITSYEKWWDARDPKVRNKIRKAQKNGVALRTVELDDDFAKGVESIYNESPLRQGRKFYHYGKNYKSIKEELASFLDKSIIVGAYHNQELIGFMKLFKGMNVLRTIHIIAKLSQRDKPVMDALIARAVEMCEAMEFEHLQYGLWTAGGVGSFRAKHGFERFEFPRFFVPLNFRGQIMLKLKLHLPIRERFPGRVVDPLINIRARWNRFRYGIDKSGALS